MKTAILVHGCHLSAEEWEEIEWGTPPLKGRIPKAFQMIMLENPVMVVFGSGASTSSCGLVEGEYIRQELLFCFDFDTRLWRYFPEDIDEMDSWKSNIFDLSVADTTSKSTIEELQNMKGLIETYDIEKLILISSPTHLPRCIRDAHTILGDCKPLKVLCGVPSDTCYAESTAKDVVIIEPPHRKDRSDVPIHKTAAKLFNIPPDKMEEFQQRFESLLAEYM